MSSTKTTVSTGVGFVGLLTIVLIVLKILGHVEWGWLWVLSPLIFSFCGSLIVILVLVLACILAGALS